MAAASMALAKIERAHQMYREGRHTDALEFYTEALSIAKTKAQKIALHSNRAACYLKLHDFRKAAEECTSVLELDHQHTGALMLRAQTLVTLKEYQSALFDVNRLMELNPSSEVYANLHTRLKTQLSLAPIPEESEEETLIAEEELYEKEGKRNTEVPLAGRCSKSANEVVEYPRTNNEVESAQEVISEEDITKPDDNSELPNNKTQTVSHHMQETPIQNKNKDSLTAINAKVSDKTETASHHMQETPIQNKNKESPTAINSKASNKTETVSQHMQENSIQKKNNISVTAAKETAVACRQDTGKHGTVDPKEHKVISQPKVHSRFDYSRWDQVDTDSSSDDDDDDEDEEEQPRYRFRVRTFGVCPVK